MGFDFGLAFRTRVNEFKGYKGQIKGIVNEKRSLKKEIG